MIGIYFSGTGNTRYCIERFLHYYHPSDENQIFAMEDPEAAAAIGQTDRLVFGYPVYFSNMPKIVKDFIKGHQPAFAGKEIFIIATMGLFSGDGCGCSARLFRQYGAVISGGLHIKMPDSIADEKALKKTPAQNRQLIVKADQKIGQAVRDLKQGKGPADGLSVPAHMAGLFGQRLWFYNKTSGYTDKLKINPGLCTGCGKCVSLCPMNNLSIAKRTVTAGNRCTMCYRCINHCPGKAITLLGPKVVAQGVVDFYI